MPTGKGFRTEAKAIIKIIGKLNELKSGTEPMSRREFMAWLKENDVRTNEYAVNRYAKAAGYVFRVGKGTGSGVTKGGWIDRSRIVAMELVALLHKIGEPVSDNLIRMAEGLPIDDPEAPRYSGRTSRTRSNGNSTDELFGNK